MFSKIPTTAVGGACPTNTPIDAMGVVTGDDRQIDAAEGRMELVGTPGTHPDQRPVCGLAGIASILTASFINGFVPATMIRLRP